MFWPAWLGWRPSLRWCFHDANFSSFTVTTYSREAVVWHLRRWRRSIVPKHGREMVFHVQHGGAEATYVQAIPAWPCRALNLAARRLPSNQLSQLRSLLLRKSLSRGDTHYNHPDHHYHQPHRVTITSSARPKNHNENSPYYNCLSGNNHTGGWRGIPVQGI